MIEPKLWSYEDFPESTASTEGMESMKLAPAEMISVRDGFVYRSKDGADLRMHVISPAAFVPGVAAEPLPCVIFVNGSAWFQQMLLANVAQQIKIARRGYVVVLVEYRHSGIAPFPAQVEDTKAAVRYVKKHAAELGIDPEKCVLWGDSSGGHTVVMAGITAEDFLPCEEDADIDCSVKAIVDYFGPVDVSKMCLEHSTMDHTLPESPEGAMLGHVNVLENPELVAKTVPTNYISRDRDIPPLLIIHGTKDRLVPFAQSVLLYEKLRDEGKDARFIRLEGADHGSGEFWTEEILDIADGFIRKYI